MSLRRCMIALTSENEHYGVHVEARSHEEHGHADKGLQLSHANARILLGTCASISHPGRTSNIFIMTQLDGSLFIHTLCTQPERIENSMALGGV